jgi:predicted nucleic acid-binding protein
MVYPVDTDLMVDVSRQNAAAATFLDSLDDPAISIITAHELVVGARDKRDVANIDSLIAAFPLIHLDAGIGQRAYDLLKRYTRPDGLRTFDSLIAATAIEHGYTLISRNRKHFAMIDRLTLEVPRY